MFLTVALRTVVASDPSDDYATIIKPIIRERCLACHGALKQEAGLRLDTVQAMLQGGDSGNILVSKAVSDSLLWSRITSVDEDSRMPPEGEPLSPPQLNAIRLWIASNPQPISTEEAESDPSSHWSFHPPKKELQLSESALRNQNPIDFFIEQKRMDVGTIPQPSIEKPLWLRRVSLDLTGLPPSLAEQDEFLADTTPQSYEKVVERLLSSPQYSERWGRHWMDIWRYSDWWGLGEEVRNSQKHMWHWRDWILESLQADKGYDQMLVEMLAADEIYPEDASKIRATGYLARQYFRFNRTTWMDETIEHTAKGMLGLTLNCSKCHDHKYDPISQKDYYRFRAIFEPYQVRMDRVPGDETLEQNGIPRVFDCNLNAQTFLHIRGDERRPDETQSIQPDLPSVLCQSASFAPIPVQLPAAAHAPQVQQFVLDYYFSKAQTELKAAKEKRDHLVVTESGGVATTNSNLSGIDTSTVPTPLDIANQEVQQLESEIDSIEARYRADCVKMHNGLDQKLSEKACASQRKSERLLAVLQLSRLQRQLADSAEDKKEDLRSKLKEAEQKLALAIQRESEISQDYSSLKGAEKTAESNVETEEHRTLPFPTTSTGRRKALAMWLVHRENPLTARVAVNHIWLRHFGKPLVATVFDFGRKGSKPTHPELLDWLAVEFIEHNWSMKHIHRLMVLSDTYKQSSSELNTNPINLSRDPDNVTYWRMNTLRMESQIVRDSLLFLAKELDFTVGGPSIPTSKTESNRRSLYYFHSHNDHDRFLSNFDDANVLDCYRRNNSIVPQQALAMENSELANRCTERIAEQVSKRNPGPLSKPYVVDAFRYILGFSPSEQELQLVSDAMLQLHSLLEKDANIASEGIDKKSKESLIRSLLNHNDFISIR